MEKCNILFFVPWITKGRGGTENVGSTVANEMARRGHNVSIATFDSEYSESKWELVDSINLIYLEDKIITAQDHFNMLISICSKGKPDIIVGLHMNKEFYKYVYCGYKLNVPVILSEHINPYFPRKIGRFTRKEREFIFGSADHIHLITDEFKTTLPPNFLEKVTVINNTVEKIKRTAQPEKEIEKNILTVCRLVPRKQVDLLIKAFSSVSEKYSDWKLNIVGDGDELNRLRELCISLNISEQVCFLGYSENTYPFYENANIFVLASETEGFPLSSLEAMQHGLPIIGFEDCSGLNQQVINGVNGTLCDRSNAIQSLSEALVLYMNDSSLRKRHGLNGIDFYKKNYSNEIIYNQWENMIVRVCDKKNNTLYEYEKMFRDSEKELMLDKIFSIGRK